jgi:hypothetical protein
MIATIVDWHALLTAIWASAAAGVGVTVAYGVALLGGARAVDLRRSGQTAAAALYALLGMLGAAIVVGAIVYGIVILSG